MAHKPVTTLAELDALDHNEITMAYLNTERSDPEPGPNHSRSYHHGWRTRMMDLHEIPTPDSHRALTRAYVERQKRQKEAAARHH